MNCKKKYSIVLASIYFLFFLMLVISYYTNQRDQLIFLTIIGLPTSFVFFAVGNPDWSAELQYVVIGLLGLLQYSLLGYFVGKIFCKKRN